MGHLIKETAESRGHKIVAVIDADNTADFSSRAFREADAAIEFTTPGTAVDNILASFAAGVPVVCGTTGWLDALPEIKDLCEKGRGTLLYGSNFSVGVNIFMAVNRYLSRIMADFPEYSPSMLEIHHIHKLDHPSGTAITLAEELVESNPRIEGWKEPVEGEKLKEGILPVAHLRQGEVPGTHIVEWESGADKLTISHEAKSRAGFALGAVMAAEWIKGRQGFFTVGSMLSSITGTQGLFE